ncbi:RusA family crossover junction endodeoxyribonuclease [Novosphingobium sp.]|uniref:RusA family crossover junction endodeoxyribonuclease n=1 Tax=Novosphingobium sp. TaxID=1874826 RepID=UPI003D6D0793
MPTPRPRARCITPAGRKPIVTMYSPKEYKEWQQEALRLLKAVSPDLIEGPVEVVLTALVAKPKSTKLSAPKPDVDNYAKGVLDVITQDGRFWNDDTQVVSLGISKRWTTELPGYQVVIKSL